LKESLEILTLRPARYDDCRLLWCWANDPEVRKVSINTEPIPWEQHQDWFKKKIESDTSWIYILEYKENPIGQIRFDQVVSGEAEISVSIDSSMRGKSYGTKIIQLGIKKICEDTNLRYFIAYIRPNNIPSMRVFEKAGFCKEIIEFRDKLGLYKMVRRTT